MALMYIKQQPVLPYKTSRNFFTYKSGDTQLLGLVLEKATGRSLSDYAAEKLWQPLVQNIPHYGAPIMKKEMKKHIAVSIPIPAILHASGN
jgi:CubicO group peptidase (beta-lactamase class C family)